VVAAAMVEYSSYIGYLFKILEINLLVIVVTRNDKIKMGRMNPPLEEIKLYSMWDIVSRGHGNFV